MYLSYHIDLSIVVIFLGLCLFIGLIKAKGVTTLKQFALGYQNITVTVLSCTIFAASINANSTIAAVRDIYYLGIIFVIVQLIKPLHWYITSKIFAQNIEQFRDCLTLSHIMYKLYGTSGRIFSAFISIAMCIGFVSIQGIAMGELLHYFFNINLVYGVLISCGIFTIYSALGGIRSVIPTEIFKMIVFVFIIQITYIVMSMKYGSFTEIIMPKLPSSHTNFNLIIKNWQLITIFIFTALLPTYTAPFIQRCLIANSSKQLVHSLKIVGILYTTFCVAICIVAYISKAYFPNINPYEALFVYIAKLLPTGAIGLFIAGLLAAFMSSGESHLSAVGVIIAHDLIAPIKSLSQKQEMIVLRISTVTLSLVSIFVALSGKQLLELVWTVFTFWDATMLVPLAAGFLGFKTNSRSFICSLVCSITTVLITRILVGKFGTASLFFGVFASSIGLFVSHYTQVINGTVIIKRKAINRSKLRLITKSKLFTRGALIYVKHKFTDNNINVSQFCTITLAYYLIYSFNTGSQPPFKQLGYMIIIGYFFCLILIFRDFIFSKKIIKNYMPLYCNLLITYCLPFVSSYMLFVTENNNFWVINALIVTSSLFYLVDTSRFLLFSAIGIILGYVAFIYTDIILSPEHLTNVFIDMSYIISSFLFVCLFLARKKRA